MTEAIHSTEHHSLVSVVATGGVPFLVPLRSLRGLDANNDIYTRAAAAMVRRRKMPQRRERSVSDHQPTDVMSGDVIDSEGMCAGADAGEVVVIHVDRDASALRQLLICLRVVGAAMRGGMLERQALDLLRCRLVRSATDVAILAAEAAALGCFRTVGAVLPTWCAGALTSRGGVETATTRVSNAACDAEYLATDPRVRGVTRADSLSGGGIDGVRATAATGCVVALAHPTVTRGVLEATFVIDCATHPGSVAIAVLPSAVARAGGLDRDVLSRPGTACLYPTGELHSFYAPPSPARQSTDLRFGEGDVIRVVVDMDQGVLSFIKLTQHVAPDGSVVVALPWWQAQSTYLTSLRFGPASDAAGDAAWWAVAYGPSVIDRASQIEMSIAVVVSQAGRVRLLAM